MQRRWVPKLHGNEKVVKNYRIATAEAANAETIKRPSRKESVIRHFRHKAFAKTNNYPIRRAMYE